MPTSGMTTTTRRDPAAEVAYLTRALKAASLRESVARLAERARADGWTHEEFLIACLQRESPPAKPTAARAVSALPASPRGKAWRSSTSTTPAASNAT
jgi:hypothetical protein